MELQRPREAAALTLSLLDLTNLREDCTPQQIATLCQRAHTEFGNTAAICIWPRFVAQARAAFGKDHTIRIATVVNFPSGDLDVATVVAETEAAIGDGADEIDLVIPYRKFMAGDESAVAEMIAAVRKACAAPVLLKVILETGELKDKALIRRASEIAIAEGADFIKTSTGKVAVNATLEAADIMLQAIRDSKRRWASPAGGIGTVEDATLYLRLAETIMAPNWAMPSTFRFGASGVLDDVLNVLAGGEPAKAASGY